MNNILKPIEIEREKSTNVYVDPELIKTRGLRTYANLFKNDNLRSLDEMLYKNNSWLDEDSSLKRIELESEISTLKAQLRESYNELKKANSDKDKKIEEFKLLEENLKSKEKISHIIPRICEEARELLLSDDNFKNLFKDGESCEAVVVSIDIRRSTELMLKARRPELFSKFITELSQK